MPFCMNCGNELPEGAKFCLECGTSVGTSEQKEEKRKTVYDGEIHKCEYEDTESYKGTEMFINNRELLLSRLLVE